MSDDFEAIARHAFVEEAAEMLGQFEAGVLQLGGAGQLHEAAREQANSAFRAIHTIKGSAGIFGFRALVQVSHELETVLDMLRANERPMSAELQSLLLRGHDVVKALCDEAREDSELSAVATELFAQLRAWTHNDGPAAIGSQELAQPSEPLPANVQLPAAQAPIARGPRMGADDDSQVRVSAAKLDALIERVAQASTSVALAHEQALLSGASSLVDATLQVQSLMSEAREDALGLRMVPMREVFARFPRLVRDTSLQLGKQVELLTSDGDAEIDRVLMEGVIAPLTHLLRNSIDHGLESPEERTRRGKPSKGHVMLSAHRDAGHVVIEVRDDGRGLDRAAIRQRAIERGLISADARLSDADTLRLICEPGFSTARAVTEVSGRGVGMDVVKRNVQALRGELYLSSEPGQGTTIGLRVPMTLALLDGFWVRVGQGNYLVPLDAVSECGNSSWTTQPEAGAAVGTFHLRDEVLPFVDLSLLFDAGAPVAAAGRSRAPRRSVMVVRSGSLRMGLVVDRLLGEQQVIIKSLGELFSGLPLFSGAAILADGSIGTVLDVSALFDLLRQGQASLVA